MRAAVFHHAKKVTCDNVPDPKLKERRDAILRVTSTAICGSDLHIYNGYFPSSHTLPLTDVSHAYQSFNDKTEDCVKVVLKPGLTVEPRGARITA